MLCGEWWVRGERNENLFFEVGCGCRWVSVVVSLSIRRPSVIELVKIKSGVVAVYSFLHCIPRLWFGPFLLFILFLSIFPCTTSIHSILEATL